MRREWPKFWLSSSFEHGGGERGRRKKEQSEKRQSKTKKKWKSEDGKKGVEVRVWMVMRYVVGTE